MSISKQREHEMFGTGNSQSRLPRGGTSTEILRGNLEEQAKYFVSHFLIAV